MKGWDNYFPKALIPSLLMRRQRNHLESREGRKVLIMRLNHVADHGVTTPYRPSRLWRLQVPKREHNRLNEPAFPQRELKGEVYSGLVGRRPRLGDVSTFSSGRGDSSKRTSPPSPLSSSISTTTNDRR